MSSPPCYIAVVDLECMCSDTHSGDETVQRADMETIEIGAVMLRGEDFAPVDHFERFARPIVHRHLTDFCTELTSITQADVDTADTFPVVFRAFLGWLTDWQAGQWGSWGNFDLYQLQLDCRRHGIGDQLAELPAHVNIKAWWAKQMGRKRVGLGRAVQTAGLTWQGRAHRGIDDARMIAQLLPDVGWPANVERTPCAGP